MPSYHAIYDYPVCEEFQPYSSINALLADEAEYYKRNRKAVASKVLEINYQTGTERLLTPRELDRLCSEWEQEKYERMAEEYGEYNPEGA